jgi:hypothetical protein
MCRPPRYDGISFAQVPGQRIAGGERLRDPVTFGVRQQLFVPLASDLATDIRMDHFSSPSRGVVMTSNLVG